MSHLALKVLHLEYQHMGLVGSRLECSAKQGERGPRYLKNPNLFF